MFAISAMGAWFHDKVLISDPTSVIVSVNEMTNIRVVTPLADVFIAFAFENLLNLNIVQPFIPKLLDPLGKLVCIPIQNYMSWAKNKCGLTYVCLKGFGMRLPAGCSVMTSA